MSRLSETFEIGGLTVAALSDGAPDRALGGFFLFHGVEPAEWARAVGVTSPEDPVPFNFGVFLVRGDGHTTLIDSGYGPEARQMGVPGGGELLERIQELGVGLDEIDVVVHTHLHFDHCGWNAGRAEDGPLTFPNATYYVARAELDFWMSEQSEQRAQTAGPLAKTLRNMTEAARLRMQPVVAAGRVQTFDGEHAVTESLTMVPTPGHTPGHCAVLLASQGEHLLVTGDAAHHPAHFEHHDWLPSVDLDPAESQRSRGKMSALAADRNALVTGPHFPILTLGRVRRVEGGYKWEGA